MNLFDLHGKTALVTGGNGGLGLGMAKGLAGAGADIVIVGRKADKNNAAAVQIKDAFPETKVFAIECDATKEDQVAAAVAKAVKTFGRLNILINNAGVNMRKSPQDYTLAEWNDIVSINLTSAFLFSRAAYPELKRAGGGKVINIGSMTTVFGSAWAGPYAATKGGISQYSKSCAVAWAKDNIQVNCLLPGWIDTDMTRAAKTSVPGLDQKVTDATPAGRWGRPEDLAGTAVFLSSRASDFVTGIDIPVDGGFCAAIL